MGRPPEIVETVTRLNPDVYRKLEDKFQSPVVSATVTDIQAGYLLGVQAVLKELRRGYVTAG